MSLFSHYCTCKQCGAICASQAEWERRGHRCRDCSDEDDDRYYCEDCGMEIGWQQYMWNSGLCDSCADERERGI